MIEDYENEINMAKDFVLSHNWDIKLQIFLKDMRARVMPHSERWSLCYDWFAENYPEVTGAVVTGMAYYLEG